LAAVWPLAVPVMTRWCSLPPLSRMTTVHGACENGPITSYITTTNKRDGTSDRLILTLVSSLKDGGARKTQ
jgi:hypothetical protein